jgi:hypothetical protein
MIRLLRYLAILSVLGAASSPAMATLITVDFEEVAPRSYFENLTSNGFRISPSCHVDIAQFSQTTSIAMGWDRSGCLSGGGNPDYLGQTPQSGFSSVFIDYFDNPFTFESFFNPFGTMASVISSKGGVLDFGGAILGANQVHPLDGSQWIGIKWIEFTYNDPGAPNALIDDLIFRVPGRPLPEPGTLPLVAVGAIALVAAFRRRLTARPSRL